MISRTATFTVIIICAALFTLAVYTVGTESVRGQLSNPLAKDGKALWQKHNCTACHQLYGLGGYMGPDLTNVMSAPGKGENYVRALLQTGTARMPNFNLTTKETEALVSYLRACDLSGRSPVIKPKTTYWGSVEWPE